MQTHRVALYFFNKAGIHSAAGSCFHIESVAFGDPQITSPQHIFMRGSNGIEFLAPVGQLYHVDSYNEQLVIVRGGKHIGFVGICLYLW